MRPAGFKHTNETKEKMSKQRSKSYKNKTFKGGFKKGHKKTKADINRARQMGLNNKGRKHSDEVNKKKGHPGKKNSSWQGGKSFIAYPKEWTKILKESIRERDNHKCRLCCTHKQKIKLHVHHINYDKKNCNPKNLITLCIQCHGQTQKNRKLWAMFFKRLMEEIMCNMQ